jgi:hypothetical protein
MNTLGLGKTVAVMCLLTREVAAIGVKKWLAPERTTLRSFMSIVLGHLAPQYVCQIARKTGVTAGSLDTSPPRDVFL